MISPMLLIVLGSLGAITLLVDAVWYVLLIPDLTQPPNRKPSLPRAIYLGLFGICYALGLLRIPFSIMPYTAKLILFFLLGRRFEEVWHHFGMQVVRLAGGDKA